MKIQIINEKITPEDLYPQTSGSAGIDLKAILSNPINLYPKEKYKFSTGIKVAIPDKHVGILVPRSSTGLRGLWLANIVGIIDSDYRGEVIVGLINTSELPITINPMDRIAQLIVTTHYNYNQISIVDSLDETERNSNGFGSTGV